MLIRKASFYKRTHLQALAVTAVYLPVYSKLLFYDFRTDVLRYLSKSIVYGFLLRKPITLLMYVSLKVTNCYNNLYFVRLPFRDVTTLYPSSRSSTCIFLFFCIYCNKFQQRPMQNMGKNIKSYATTPSPFPQEREGSLTAKSPKSFA